MIKGLEFTKCYKPSARSIIYKFTRISDGGEVRVLKDGLGFVIRSQRGNHMYTKRYSHLTLPKRWRVLLEDRIV